MGLFDHFPYTNFHELNLDWVLNMVKELNDTVENFVALNTIKYADPIQWNITTQYETNTVVIDANDGTAYISVHPVPTGVAITNTDYWTPIFTLNLLSSNQNITLRDDGSNILATFASVTGDWLLWNNTLYKVTRAIAVNEAYVVGYNLNRYSVELFIKDYINNVLNIIGELSDLNTTDKSSIVNAINNVLNIIGELSDLNTTDKSSIVNAINELLTLIQAIPTASPFKVFNTVNDMIASDISDGEYCYTLGFYTPGDGGGAYYKISTTSSGISPITLSSGLYAIILNPIYINQIGAKGDGSTDSLSYINDFNNYGLHINLQPNQTYLISGAISLDIGINFYGNNATLNSSTGEHFNLAIGYSGNIIEDLRLRGGANNKYAITLNRPGCIIRNVKYENYDSNFIALLGTGANDSAYETTIEDCYYTHNTSNVDDLPRIGIHMDFAGGLIRIKNTNLTTCTKAIDIIKAANVIIETCNISECTKQYFPTQSNCYAIYCEYGRNINIINNYIENCNLALYVNDNRAKNINLNNNYINLLDQSNYVILLDYVSYFTSNSNYIRSTKASSYAYSISSNCSNIVLINDYIDVTNEISDSNHIAIIIGRTVTFANKAIEFVRRKIQPISGTTLTITRGGLYTDDGLASGSTVNASVTLPEGHIFEYLPYQTCTLNVTTDTSQTFTWSLSSQTGSAKLINLGGKYIKY